MAANEWLQKNHVSYGLAWSAHGIEQFGWINMRAITFSFVDQSSSRGLKKCGENIPTIPEVIGAHTLNFKPNFKFSSYFFGGGPPSQFGYALASFLQSLVRIKIWGHLGTSPRKGRNIVSRTMSTWVGQYARQQLFCLWTKVHQHYFAQRRRGGRWWTTFPIYDFWIRSGDICDQSRKLSEIAPDCERFSPSQILGGRLSKSCTHIITPSSRHVIWIKICDDIPISP